LALGPYLVDARRASARRLLGGFNDSPGSTDDSQPAATCTGSPSPEATNLTNEDRVSIFNKHRRLFERVASKKYDSHDVTENNEIVVSAADIAKYQRG